MHGIKRRMLCLLLCLCFCAGCGSSRGETGAMLLEEGPDQRQQTYTTEVIVPCTLEIHRETSASVGYWQEVNVTCAGMGGAALVEICVTKNQTVKAGDVLATFDVPYSNAELDALYAQREIAWLQYQSGLSGYTVALQDAQSALAAQTPGSVAYRICEQDVIRAQSAYDYYVSSQSISMSAIEEQIARLDENLEKTAIVSPIDGVVTSVTGAIRAGDIVNDQTALCTVANQDDTYFYTQYNDVFPFYSGAEATLYSRYYNDGEEYPATVLSSPADTGAVTGNVILVADDPVVQQEMAEVGRISFAVVCFTLENVIAVPNTALHHEDDNSYVMLLEDGKPVRRYVNAGEVWTRDDGENAVQILEGLQPGDVIITG